MNLNQKILSEKIVNGNIKFQIKIIDKTIAINDEVGILRYLCDELSKLYPQHEELNKYPIDLTNITKLGSGDLRTLCSFGCHFSNLITIIVKKNSNIDNYLPSVAGFEKLNIIYR